MTLVNSMETGSYTGNGTSQSITIGWQPEFVLVFSSKSGGNPNQRGGALKCSAMDNASSIRSRQGTAYTTGLVTLDSAGFSVGSDDSANRSGETYHWFAMRAAPEIDCGSYTGTDPTDQAFALNRQPSFIFTFNHDTPQYGIKHPSQATDTFWSYATSAGVDNGVTIDANGFTASGTVANSVEAHSYASFYDLVGANRHWEEGTYTGDGNATQSIALGRQPKLVMIQAADTNNGIFKTDTMSGDSAAQVASSTDYLSGRVTLLSTGFQVATAINASGVSYRWIAGYF
jgi:hypothetical protein